MQIVFLGTSAMVPTKDRNHFSFYMKYKDEGILFDCGEGTQRQLRIAGIRPSRITKIFISHMHGDHIFGLPGLLQTLSASQYEGTLKIYGLPGIKKVINTIIELFAFENKLDMEVIEITKRKFLETEEYYVESYLLDHGVPCTGFRFIEKDRSRIDMKKATKLGLTTGPLLGKLQKGIPVTVGKKTITPEEVTYKSKGKIVGFIADTAMTENCREIAKDADLLVSEATHTSYDADKAGKYKHFTAREAGMVAKEMGVKKLVLSHFSQRYKDIKEVVDDAKQEFENTIGSEDFMKIRL